MVFAKDDGTNRELVFAVCHVFEMLTALKANITQLGTASSSGLLRHEAAAPIAQKTAEAVTANERRGLQVRVHGPVGRDLRAFRLAMPPITRGHVRAREIWIDNALCREARCRRVALRQRRVVAFVIAPHLRAIPAPHITFNPSTNVP
jgi:hypothetical protein